MPRRESLGPRGRCSVCGRDGALDDDGMTRRHRRKGSTETGPIAGARDLCLGSYELPDTRPVPVKHPRHQRTA